MFRVLINLLNFCRATYWRVVLGVRGGRIGRGCTIQPGVRLACGPACPIILGDGVRLMRGVVLSASGQGRIVLEDRAYVGEYSVVASEAEVHVGRDTIVAAHAVILDSGPRFDDLAAEVGGRPVQAAPIRIGRDVWLGAGVKVLRGVTIADQAVIGAGAVVTSDIAERGVAVGVPARILRRRGEPIKEGPPTA